MTKQEIIDAAFKVWGRDFYQSTSLAKLARTLGVSKPALYRHFKNKQSLLEAMYDHFFNEYADFIKPQYDQAILTQDTRESFLIMIRIISEYYLRHRDAFIFSLVKFYGPLPLSVQKNITHQFLVRGIDLRRFSQFEQEPSGYPSLIQLIFATLAFMAEYFYKSLEAAPSVEALLGWTQESMFWGLGLDERVLDALDYEKLEALIIPREYEAVEDEALLKAVAGAVAEAGPWKASMDMIARRSGLSKSSLYSHFKNKEDMLNRLLITELDRMMGYVEESILRSEVSEERLYLAVFSAADYLRSRLEILLAANWIRYRRQNLHTEIPPRLWQVFSDLGLNLSSPEGAERLGLGIFFLIVHTLMRRPEGLSCSEMPKTAIRRLFRFIALGLEGFSR